MADKTTDDLPGRASYSSFVSSNLSTAERSENSPGRALGSVLSTCFVSSESHNAMPPTLIQFHSCRPYAPSDCDSSVMVATGASFFSAASDERKRRRTWCCCAIPVMGTSLSFR